MPQLRPCGGGHCRAGSMPGMSPFSGLLRDICGELLREELSVSGQQGRKHSACVGRFCCFALGGDAITMLHNARKKRFPQEPRQGIIDLCTGMQCLCGTEELPYNPGADKTEEGRDDDRRKDSHASQEKKYNAGTACGNTGSIAAVRVPLGGRPGISRDGEVDPAGRTVFLQH